MASKEADALLELARGEIICFKCNTLAEEGRITVIGATHSTACRLAHAVKAMVEKAEGECMLCVQDSERNPCMTHIRDEYLAAKDAETEMVEAGHAAAFSEEK